MGIKYVLGLYANIEKCFLFKTKQRQIKNQRPILKGFLVF